MERSNKLYVKKLHSIEMLKKLAELIGSFIPKGGYKVRIESSITGKDFESELLQGNEIESPVFVNAIKFYSEYPELGVSTVRIMRGTVYILRYEQDEISGIFTIEDLASFESTYKSIKNSFDFVNRTEALMKSVPAPLKEQINIYSQNIDTLQSIVIKLSEATTKQIEENANHVRTITQELQNQYSKMEENLKNTYLKKDEALNVREKTIIDREHDFDLRESRGVRRDLLKDIQELIGKHQTITLSTETNKKRNATMKACVIAGIVALFLIGYGLYLLTINDSFNFIKYAPFTSGVLIMVSILVFFLRWTNAWSKQHAEIEFQNIKFNNDILRASWIAELMIESQQTTKTEMPQYFVEQLSKNLFDNVVLEEKHHPIDDLVKTAKVLQKLKLPFDAEEKKEKKEENKK